MYVTNPAIIVVPASATAYYPTVRVKRGKLGHFVLSTITFTTGRALRSQLPQFRWTKEGIVSDCLPRPSSDQNFEIDLFRMSASEQVLLSQLSPFFNGRGPSGEDNMHYCNRNETTTSARLLLGMGANGGGENGWIVSTHGEARSKSPEVITYTPLE
ncbi:hypothetical protein FS842_008772 [Serendipita sp. 407]|nr:hypothetical protein FS842_008772 [Serendipita sp. 407]